MQEMRWDWRSCWCSFDHHRKVLPQDSPINVDNSTKEAKMFHLPNIYEVLWGCFTSHKICHFQSDLIILWPSYSWYVEACHIGLQHWHPNHRLPGILYIVSCKTWFLSAEVINNLTIYGHFMKWHWSTNTKELNFIDYFVYCPTKSCAFYSKGIIVK